jgi:hypothetical protein
MKKVAILQSNYVPWKGYFDLIAAVDEFILYDDVQFTKNDWRNRNRIKTPQGIQWMSIPVGDKIGRKICEVSLINSDWQVKHWKTLEANYRRSPFFEEISLWLKPLYLIEAYTNLSHLNRRFIEEICSYLGINTNISNSSDYEMIDGKTERLANLCEQVGGTEYISGPSAIEYIDANCFFERGINLTWFHYNGYSEYPQLWGEFSHAVTILDLLFNAGKQAPRYMRYVKL